MFGGVRCIFLKDLKKKIPECAKVADYEECIEKDTHSDSSL